MQALDLMIFVLEKAPGRDSGDCMVCGGDGAVNGSMSLRVDKKTAWSSGDEIWY